MQAVSQRVLCSMRTDRSPSAAIMPSASSLDSRNGSVGFASCSSAAPTLATRVVGPMTTAIRFRVTAPALAPITEEGKRSSTRLLRRQGTRADARVHGNSTTPSESGRSRERPRHDPWAMERSGPVAYTSPRGRSTAFRTLKPRHSAACITDPRQLAFDRSECLAVLAASMAWPRCESSRKVLHVH